LENSSVSFEEVLGWHMSCGVVYVTPDVFMLAHEVRWDGEELHEDGVANCWFIELSGGSGRRSPFKEFMKVAPRRLEYVAWHKHGSTRPHVYGWEKFAVKIKLEE
jgi:hypothetical protein